MPGDAAILDLWDRGERRAALDRAVLLAGEDGADLPLDARDRRLLSLARDLGGDAVPLTIACAVCGEAMDVTLSATALIASGSAADGLHAPTSRDLADALALPDPAARRRLLAARAAGVDAITLDEAQVAAIDARLAAAAGPEDIRIACRCPACNADGEASIDAVAHAWAMVETHARDLTDTIATLARAYGWTEADVLALSPARRARYAALAA